MTHRTWSLALLMLAGCGTVAPVPPDVFLRLEVDAPTVRVAKAWSSQALRVAPLTASGLHKERPLAYTRDAGSSLQQSHHQLWIDSPERLLQQALARYLRAAGVASQVDTAHGVAALAVEGRILRFEEVIDTGGTTMNAVVELILRDLARERVLMTREYNAAEPVGEDTPTAAARAMGRAVATICAAFISDVGSVLAQTPLAGNTPP